MSFCAPPRAKSWRRHWTKKLRSLGFPKSPPLKILDPPMSKVKPSIRAFRSVTLPHGYGNAHAVWNQTVLPATRQMWHSWHIRLKFVTNRLHLYMPIMWKEDVIHNTGSRHCIIVRGRLSHMHRDRKFSGIAISKAKILTIIFLNEIYGSNFIKQHSESV